MKEKSYIEYVTVYGVVTYKYMRLLYILPIHSKLDKKVPAKMPQLRMCGKVH